MIKTVVIVNPQSGQERADRAKRLLLELAGEMSNTHVRLTESPNHAITLAEEAVADGVERIIVAGGDGTINQVINGIGDADVEVGIVPLGTGNVLAHDLCIPRNDVEAALKIIRCGNIKKVDLATANGRRFLLMAGAGLDAAVVGSVSRKLKDVWGTMAYAPAAFEQLLRYAPTKITLTFENGDTYKTEAFGVVAANCGSYAYNFKIAPKAVFDDGLLDVLVFEKNAPAPKLQLAGHAIGAMFVQDIGTPRNSTYFKVKKIRIDSDPPVKVQVDGDVCGETPVDINVLPKALKLIVP